MAGALISFAGVTSAAPTYSISNVLVPPDQYSGEADLTPAPVWKPHETDSAATPTYWISSNERGEEAGPPGQETQFDKKGGITIFAYGTNAVLSTLVIEDACIPVVLPNGTLMKQFGGCAPDGAEGHPRHPHGIDIDDANKIAWQVIEHSGLKWNPTRTGFRQASTTDEESGLLVAYDISDLTNPKILRGYVLGHASEEVVVNPVNHKAYVGNHEPSPTNVQCFVSVINPSAALPYKFIDLPGTDCVQGVGADPGLNTVNGTTHFGEKMYTFNSANDTIAYSVNIRPAFDAFVTSLPPSEQFDIPAGWIIHMHDLTTDRVNHRAYQTIHTIAAAEEVTEDEETAEVEGSEITGRWVAEVDTNPASATFKAVHIIDLSNGQSVPAVPDHHDAVGTGLPFEQLFIHAHFLDVDPARNALLVSGEHTGNLAVVDTTTRLLQNVHSISRLIPNCTPDELEPHVHGVNIQGTSGTAYVSDEGEHCFYESVTILQP
jgi:DNA-binding beta-propeller fold protein YncE